MSVKPTTKELTTYWRQQVEAWQGSGQSQRTFCGAHDLDCYRFVYWRRKFQRHLNGD